ncbi:MAG: 1-(5-phosphoribosyl)-5-[(5-phosphoribosylamino)methylideneamino] imidazole-4-carboxamide isomerase [Candidatus Dormibacteraeota bacterium]|nr:1-(5-phosphoribosyl)-5-[(5-phosphoribosylamino)methylideneamino] imidazole-4-carboxamide isomerase [Candidatus Dormibacteraeota bacterium]
MLVIPSVDVRAGRVVRLLRGDYAHETIFEGDAVATVEVFAEVGARRVHLVDLDAARGRPDEASTSQLRAAVSALAARGVDAQVGGGVRDRETAQRWIDLGAAYVVIGSLAVSDPRAAEALCTALPHRVLAGLDVRDGAARAQGWTEDGGEALMHLERWRTWPLAAVVHTAIERDGTLGGPALESLREVCARFDGDVFASGGVTTLDDVAACAAAGAAGAIVGRALHEGLFDLRAALDRFAGRVRL